MHNESFGELLGQLAINSAALVRDEIELVKQEIRERLKSFSSAIAAVAIGAIIGLIALMALCAALVIGLTCYVTAAVAALVTGVALALIGGITTFVGFRQLKKMALNNEK